VPPPCLSPQPCRAHPSLHRGLHLRLCCDVIVFYDSFFGKKKSGGEGVRGRSHCMQACAGCDGAVWAGEGALKRIEDSNHPCP
jgi:hypothetical protein